jgi:hypothetical protein
MGCGEAGERNERRNPSLLTRANEDSEHPSYVSFCTVTIAYSYTIVVIKKYCGKGFVRSGASAHFWKVAADNELPPQPDRQLLNCYGRSRRHSLL